MADEKENKKEKKEASKEMSSAEAKAYRASLNKKEAPRLSDEEKREKFRVYWAEEKSKYANSKDLEQIIWLHLKSVKMAEPEQFENGIKHFGLKKV